MHQSLTEDHDLTKGYLDEIHIIGDGVENFLGTAVIKLRKAILGVAVFRGWHQIHGFGIETVD